MVLCTFTQVKCYYFQIIDKIIKPLQWFAIFESVKKSHYKYT